MHAPQAGEAFLILVEITHADLASPIRLVNYLTNVVSDGDTYTAYPFAIEFPEESADAPPAATLTVDNVSREITDALLGLDTSPDVSMKVVLASSPDTVEAGPVFMKLHVMPWTAFAVTGRLGPEGVLDEPYPADTFNPVQWPALF